MLDFSLCCPSEHLLHVKFSINICFNPRVSVRNVSHHMLGLDGVYIARRYLKVPFPSGWTCRSVWCPSFPEHQGFRKRKDPSNVFPSLSFTAVSLTSSCTTGMVDNQSLQAAVPAAPAPPGRVWRAPALKLSGLESLGGDSREEAVTMV